MVIDVASQAEIEVLNNDRKLSPLEGDPSQIEYIYFYEIIK